MEIKQLEAFSAVVRYRSYTRAAQDLGVSLPTIHSQVDMLETELGCELLLRRGKSISATEKGALLLHYAQQIMQLRQQALDELRQSNLPFTGNITIAASSIPAQYCLPELLAEINRHYPEVSFAIHHVNSADVIEEVRKGNADLGLSGMKAENSGCLYQKIKSDHLVVITPNNSEFQTLDKTFPLEALSQKPFISREQGSGTRSETERLLKKIGVDPSSLNIIAEMSLSESIKKSVAAGLGIAVISESAITEEVKDGRLLSFNIGGTELERSIYLLINQNRSEMSLAHQLFRIAKEKTQ